MATLASIKEIPAFTKKSVFIRNESELLEKIKSFVSQGPENLQIITDFDLTFTRPFKDDGSRVATTYGMFTNCPSIPESYKRKNKELEEEYRPFEVSGELSKEEKTRYMVEWYTKVNQALVDLVTVQFPWKELEDEGRKLAEYFRDGVKDVILWSEANEVPLLIFSAGMGECVQVIMRMTKLLKNNVDIISNFCELKNEKIVGIKGEIIHPLNKNETAIKKTDHYKKVMDRCNAIVMGDSLGDGDMAEGMDHCDDKNQIKIGFLSREVDSNRAAYRKKFDIVLEFDDTMDVLNAILKLIKN